MEVLAVTLVCAAESQGQWTANVTLTVQAGSVVGNSLYAAAGSLESLVDDVARLLVGYAVLGALGLGAASEAAGWRSDEWLTAL